MGNAEQIILQEKVKANSVGIKSLDCEGSGSRSCTEPKLVCIALSWLVMMKDGLRTWAKST